MGVDWRWYCSLKEKLEKVKLSRRRKPFEKYRKSWLRQNQMIHPSIYSLSFILIVKLGLMRISISRLFSVCMRVSSVVVLCTKFAWFCQCCVDASFGVLGKLRVILVSIGNLYKIQEMSYAKYGHPSCQTVWGLCWILSDDRLCVCGISNFETFGHLQGVLRPQSLYGEPHTQAPSHRHTHPHTQTETTTHTHTLTRTPTHTHAHTSS